MDFELNKICKQVILDTFKIENKSMKIKHCASILPNKSFKD